MKIKQLIFALTLALIANVNLNAQESNQYDKDNCEKYRSLYYQYLKQSMWRDAMTFWQMAYNYCGGQDSLDSKFYVNARVGYLKLLDAETNAARKIELRDSVYWVYENLIRLDSDPEWKAKYAVMLVSDDDKRFGKIDTLFWNSIHVLKLNSEASYIRAYFKHLILNTYNGAPADKKEDARSFIIDEYMLLSDYCANAIKKHTEANDADEVKRYESAQDFMEKYFLQIVKDCETLTGVVDTKMKKLPQDKAIKTEKVKKYLNLLDGKKCQSSATYAALLDTLILLDPTAEAYYLTGKYFSDNGDDSKALKYYEKAVELEGAGANKDKYTYAVADGQYKAKRYKEAFRTAKTVGGAYQGKAMIICGNAVATTANGCGESTFERKANNWLANDYYRKAAALGESVSSSQFLSGAPTQEEGFTQGVSEGSSVSLSCWGESTTARY